MAPAGLVEFLIPRTSDPFMRKMFDALMSDDPEELEAAAREANRSGRWEDDFLYELNGLSDYRSYYNGREKEFTPDAWDNILQNDQNWTMDILHDMHRRAYEQPDRPPPIQPS